MTTLSSYKRHPQFENSNVVLPGQIFVRCKKRLYVKHLMLKSKIYQLVVSINGNASHNTFIIHMKVSGSVRTLC